MSLSYCNSAEDLYAARALLDSLGMPQTKLIAKVGLAKGGLRMARGWVGEWVGGLHPGWVLQVWGSLNSCSPKSAFAGACWQRCGSIDLLLPLLMSTPPVAARSPPYSALLSSPQVERKAAVRNFEGIAHVADGIIISRGNLGLDFEPEVGGAGELGRWLRSLWLGACVQCVWRWQLHTVVCCPASCVTRLPPACCPPAIRLQVMALLQKRIISRCNQLGKPVLITRIVDTMVTTPRPTRAGTVCSTVLQYSVAVQCAAQCADRAQRCLQWCEPVVPVWLAGATGVEQQRRQHYQQLPLLQGWQQAMGHAHPHPPSFPAALRIPLLPPAEATDVANAVLDGVDGLLLGAETLRGQHPVLTAQTVLKLCAAAEKVFDYHTHHETLMGEAFEVGGLVAGSAAVFLSRQLPACLLACLPARLPASPQTLMCEAGGGGCLTCRLPDCM